MTLVMEPPLEIVPNPPVKGIKYILHSQSVSVSSSETPSTQPAPSDVAMSPNKDKSNKFMLSKDALQYLREPKAPPANLNGANANSACAKPIDCGAISVQAGAKQDGVSEIGPGTSKTVGNDITDPGSAQEEDFDDDEIEFLECVDTAVGEKVQIVEKINRAEAKTGVNKTPSVVSKTPSVTLVLESKLEDVENDINKVVHKARSNDVKPSESEVKDALGDKIRTLNKSDLETLVMDKIIEAIATHSSLGDLNQKLTQSNNQRDRLFLRVSSLQRQVAELSKAVRTMSENVGRTQKVNKANLPLRFHRSVAVQVVLDEKVPSTQAKSASLHGPATKSHLKTRINTGQQCLTSSVANAPPLKPLVNTLTPLPPLTIRRTQVDNVNPILKRQLNSTVSVMEATQSSFQSQVQNKIRRVSESAAVTVVTSGGLAFGRAKSNVALSPALQPPVSLQIRNPAAAAASKALTAMGASRAELRVVDLTEDINASRTPSVPVSANNLVVSGDANKAVASQTGLPQYRLINPGNQFQIVQGGKSYQVITSSAHSQPLFLSPLNVNPSHGQQVQPVVTSRQQLRTLTYEPQVRKPIQLVGPLASSSNSLLLQSLTTVKTATPTTTNTTFSLNGGQLVMNPRPSGGSAMSPILLKRPFSTIPNRPGITITAASTNQQKVVYTNGFGSRQPFRSSLLTTSQGGISGGVEFAVKKFVLPPLPPPAISGTPGRCTKDIPPRPELTLEEKKEGILLSWSLKLSSNHAQIQTYQIYACSEPLISNQKSGAWKRVGDVKALPLPMACTLSQFADGNRYHFVVRGVDVYNRTGPFCEASAIKLLKKS